MTAIRVARVAHTPHIVAATLGTIARIFKIGSRRRGSLNAWSGNAGRVTEKTKGVFQTMENMSLKELADAVHENAVAHGWWEEERDTAEVFALIHSELSEALEEYRNGRPTLYYPCNAGGVCCEEDGSAHCGSRPYNPNNPEAPCSAQSKKPEGIAVELADCVIRILDFCGKEQIDIDDELKDRRAGFNSYTLPALVNTCHCLISNAYESRLNTAAYLAECVAIIKFWCEENGGNLEEAIRIKHEYNKSRPYRHGGKKC